MDPFIITIYTASHIRTKLNIGIHTDTIISLFKLPHIVRKKTKTIRQLVYVLLVAYMKSHLLSKVQHELVHINQWYIQLIEVKVYRLMSYDSVERTFQSDAKN